jgi:KDO2-lipid IV(A) lauroyltransferase
MTRVHWEKHVQPRRTWTKRVQHRLEAVLLHGLFWLLRRVPIDAASAAGGWVARTVGPRLPVSHVGRDNLRRAFPEKTRAEIERILDGVWDNLGRYVAEYPHLLRIWDHDAAHPDVVNRIEVVGRDRFLALRDSGRPAVIFTGHLGNWELLPVAAAKHGLTLTVMFRPPNNPHAAALLHAVRSEAMGPLAATGAWGGIAAAQAIMRGSHVGMLIDQHFDRGVAVPFFGRAVKTPTALAKLARRYDCDVHGARVERVGGARFRVTLTPPLPVQRSGDAEADIAATMALATSMLEGWVRERPEQWLWLHRRWRDEPAG